MVTPTMWNKHKPPPLQIRPFPLTPRPHTHLPLFLRSDFPSPHSLHPHLPFPSRSTLFLSHPPRPHTHFPLFFGSALFCFHSLLFPRPLHPPDKIPLILISFCPYLCPLTLNPHSFTVFSLLSRSLFPSPFFSLLFVPKTLFLPPLHCLPL